mmetsp:Transcript_36063/g.56304  ORF Transcript_36063/g.56304 Transcript_36063/m.56304 type:complete len:222 (-) Transcript_36063:118-783(-)
MSGVSSFKTDTRLFKTDTRVFLRSVVSPVSRQRVGSARQTPVSRQLSSRVFKALVGSLSFSLLCERRDSLVFSSPPSLPHRLCGIRPERLRVSALSLPSPFRAFSRVGGVLAPPPGWGLVSSCPWCSGLRPSCGLASVLLSSILDPPELPRSSPVWSVPELASSSLEVCVLRGQSSEPRGAGGLAQQLLPARRARSERISSRSAAAAPACSSASASASGSS